MTHKTRFAETIKNIGSIGKSSPELYFGILFFRLFQKNPSSVGALKRNGAAAKEKTADSSRVRCPFCKWQPKASSRWFCADAGFPEFYASGCGAEWNTFETGGVCPGCAHRWRWTTCLRCAEWSRHEDWYAEEGD